MGRTLQLFAVVLLAALPTLGQQPQPAPAPPHDPAEGGTTTTTKSTTGTPAAATPASTTVPAATTLETKPLRWRAIGPANMGGRIADFAVNEKEPYSMFVSVGTGGVLRTANNGTTWEPVFDKQSVASTGSVAISQTNPKLVWVGSGEGNSRNSSSWGNGIYKSIDGGDTWTNMGLPEAGDIPKVAIDPKNDDVIYAAVLGHLWGANKE
ncbi:MAG TPA: hypothetical protein VN605_13920, partial [Thermoanaerobaculia bacterium]|nr:hypothetical protein [Thermoanaerobaculia bacterium]